MKIVFFDGVCNLCNRTVSLLVDRDRAHALRFAPLQGKTYRDLPGAPPPGEEPASIVYWDGAQFYFKSGAVLRLAAELGGVYRLARAFLLVPEVLRDAVYGFVARRRYAWFGKTEACRLPTPDERGLFLD